MARGQLKKTNELRGGEVGGSGEGVTIISVRRLKSGLETLGGASGPPNVPMWNGRRSDAAAVDGEKDGNDDEEDDDEEVEEEDSFRRSSN